MHNEVNTEERYVIVADDEAFFIENLPNVLHLPGGVKILPAKSGYEAIEVYQENSEKVVLVILDQNMPLTGTETLRELRKIKLDVPVVFISVIPDETIKEDLWDLGVSAYVGKPVKRSTWPLVSMFINFLMFKDRFRLYNDNKMLEHNEFCNNHCPIMDDLFFQFITKGYTKNNEICDNVGIKYFPSPNTFNNSIKIENKTIAILEGVLAQYVDNYAITKIILENDKYYTRVFPADFFIRNEIPVGGIFDLKTTLIIKNLITSLELKNRDISESESYKIIDTLSDGDQNDDY